MNTKNLRLVPQAPEHLRALIEGADVYERSSGFRLADGIRDLMVSGEVSPDFLAQLQAATAPDPWTFGFAIVHIADDTVIGTCGYKGPPGEDGVAEIAYGIAPGYRGQGYATEAAQALVAYAFSSGRVRAVRAHTLPESNASTRVLGKCGFKKVGEVVDPEDGLVWRWEKQNVA